MTTQRDRLAAVLDELGLCDCDPDLCAQCGWPERRHPGPVGWRKRDYYNACRRFRPKDGCSEADALLARGVRVLDVETVASALRVFIWDQFDGDVDEGDRRQAEEFLAVLDGESRTENGTETTPDAEDDDGPVRWIWTVPRKEADR